MLTFGALTITRSVPEGVKHVTALEHGISQHAQLLEHSLTRDVPPHCLIDDNLHPEKNSAKTILHVQF
jgi:hypothetical protein